MFHLQVGEVFHLAFQMHHKSIHSHGILAFTHMHTSSYIFAHRPHHHHHYHHTVSNITMTTFQCILDDASDTLSPLSPHTLHFNFSRHSLTQSLHRRSLLAHICNFFPPSQGRKYFSSFPSWAFLSFHPYRVSYFIFTPQWLNSICILNLNMTR